MAPARHALLPLVPPPLNVCRLPRDLSCTPIPAVPGSRIDGRTAFEFAVTPAGSRRDVLHFDDTRQDAGWDGVWEAAAREDSLGWTAEFRIPLSQLRFGEGTGDGERRRWGVNFSRTIQRNGETVYWAPMPPDVDRRVSLFGTLVGLEELAVPRRMEWIPFISADLGRRPGDPADPFHSDNAWSASVGLDLRYGLTPELTFTGSANPDFGQVDADPAVVNLTALEAFFPERRPFFQEGAEIFDFRILAGGDERLLHSRRIGRAPQRRVRESGGWVDAPETTRILGAAKLSGQVGGHWSVAAQSALTEQATARVVDSTGTRRTEPVEPTTHYGAVRTIRNFDRGRGNVGAMLTSTHRRIESPDLAFLHDAAYAGAVDGSLRFAGGRYLAGGWVAGSHVRGSDEALAATQRSPVRFLQRPDADHLDFDPDRTSLSGWATEGFLARLAGAWTFNVLAGARNAGFEVNDLGFQQFSDLVYGGGQISYSRFTSGHHFRRWSVTSTAELAASFGAEPVRRFVQVSGDAIRHSFRGFSWRLDHSLGSLSPHALRGGPALREQPYTQARMTLHTDRRRDVNGAVHVARREIHGTAGHRTAVRGSLQLRPSSRWTVSLVPEVEWDRQPAQWMDRVAGGTTRHVHGRLSQTTVDLTVRMAWAFGPDLSLELFAQPFVSAGAHDDFTIVADPGARRFDSRFEVLDPATVTRDPERGLIEAEDAAGPFTFRDRDFKVRSLNGNAVLRWEFVPGSTLFLVWSREQRAPDRNPELALASDLRTLIGTRPTDEFMVKVSYWLNP